MMADETIKKIIDVGRYAPTGLNLQPWRFVVVQNKEIMKKLSGYAQPILAINIEGRNDAGAVNFLKRLQDKNFDLFYNAPVLILVIGGATVIQQSEEIMTELKISQNYKIIAPLIFGYPKIMPPTPEKREPVVFWMH